jgi:RNA polymerase sigma-70 factor (ECF subfamily)
VIDVLRDPESLAAATSPEPSARAELAEVRLVADLRRGETAAFEELYRREVRGLYGLALRLSCRPSEAEELTQEVFVRAWEARRTFASFAHFKNWLRRVTVNEWINRMRRMRPVALDDEGPVAARVAVAASPAGLPGLRIDLERALALLSPRLRAVLLLFDLYGLDHAEIGELLGMTVGASKVQLHRARRRLRELMP